MESAEKPSDFSKNPSCDERKRVFFSKKFVKIEKNAKNEA